MIQEPVRPGVVGLPARLRIGVIGPGRVGRCLAAGWARVGHRIIGVSTSSSEQTRDQVDAMLPGVPMVEPLQLCGADVVLVTTNDDAIGEVVGGLAELGAWRAGQVVIHCSGVHGLEVLEPAAQRGALPVAIHPAMTFTGTTLDLNRLVDCPVAVTASPIALPVAQALVMELNAQPVVVDEACRALYHAGLTHGANHLLTLVVQCQQILEAAGIEKPRHYLAALLTAALERALSEGPEGLTGPISRADSATIETHMNALVSAETSGVLEAQIPDTYSALAQATIALAEDAGRIQPREADALRAALIGSR